MAHLPHDSTSPIDPRRHRPAVEIDAQFARIAMEQRIESRRPARPDEITRRHGAPETGVYWQGQDVAALIAAQDRRRRRNRIIAAILLVLLVAAGFALGWLTDASRRTALLDFIAPTAAQARDMGWVAISESL